MCSICIDRLSEYKDHNSEHCLSLGTEDAEIASPSAENPELPEVLFLKPGLGQDTIICMLHLLLGIPPHFHLLASLIFSLLGLLHLESDAL